MNAFFRSPDGDFVTHTRGRPPARVNRGTDADVSVPTGKGSAALAEKPVPNFAERKAPIGDTKKDRPKPVPLIIY